MSAVRFGVDRLLELNPNWKNKRIGLLTNDGSTTSNNELSRVALLQKGFNIISLFSPEHGIKASQPDGLRVNNTIDKKTSLPVYSLYNKVVGFSDFDLTNLDLVLVDLPDVGVRCYTYLWSAYELMCSCAAVNIPFFILDRPNPLGGNIEWAEGPEMTKNCESFIGKCNIPFTHYCSLGEILSYLNVVNQVGSNLTIITCDWNRSQDFRCWNLAWKNPSPGLKTFNSCMLYPVLCFFEATNLNLARNQAFSFEFIGAEWVFELENFVSHELLNPLRKKYQEKGKVIVGYSLNLSSPLKNPVEIGLRLLCSIAASQQNRFQWKPYPTQANRSGLNHLDLMLGLPNAISSFSLNKLNFDSFLKEKLSVNWKCKISPFLLYK